MSMFPAVDRVQDGHAFRGATLHGDPRGKRAHKDRETQALLSREGDACQNSWLRGEHSVE